MTGANDNGSSWLILPFPPSTNNLFVNAGKRRVRAFTDLKGAAVELGAMKLAKFNTVTDYHNFMFEFGITPKKTKKA